MAQLILRPNSTIDAGTYTPDGASTLHEAVNEVVPSNLERVNTQVSGSLTVDYMTLGIDNIDVGTNIIISTVRLYVTLYIPPANILFHHIGTGEDYGITFEINGTKYAYATTLDDHESVGTETHNKLLSINPDSGVAWTESDLNDLVIGYSHLYEGGKNFTSYITHMEVVVTYEEGTTPTGPTAKEKARMMF